MAVVVNEHHWQDCLRARILSFRSKTPDTVPVDIARTLSEYDKNDEALEVYLAGQPKTVRLENGAKVSVLMDTGLPRETKIVGLDSATYSATFGDANGGSCDMTRDVPVVFGSFNRNQVLSQAPFHPCLIRPVLTGQIRAPILLPRGKGAKVTRNMMDCYALRRGSLVKTVDGVVRTVLFNDMDCSVLIDDGNYGFGYSKVADARMSQTSDVDMEALSRYLCTDSDCVRPIALAAVPSLLAVAGDDEERVQPREINERSSTYAARGWSAEEGGGGAQNDHDGSHDHDTGPVGGGQGSTGEDVAHGGGGGAGFGGNGGSGGGGGDRPTDDGDDSEEEGTPQGDGDDDEDDGVEEDEGLDDEFDGDEEVDDVEDVDAELGDNEHGDEEFDEGKQEPVDDFVGDDDDDIDADLEDTAKEAGGGSPAITNLVANTPVAELTHGENIAPTERSTPATAESDGAEDHHDVGGTPRLPGVGTETGRLSAADLCDPYHHRCCAMYMTATRRINGDGVSFPATEPVFNWTPCTPSHSCCVWLAEIRQQRPLMRQTSDTVAERIHVETAARVSDAMCGLKAYVSDRFDQLLAAVKQSHVGVLDKGGIDKGNATATAAQQIHQAAAPPPQIHQQEAPREQQEQQSLLTPTVAAAIAITAVAAEAAVAGGTAGDQEQTEERDNGAVEEKSEIPPTPPPNSKRKVEPSTDTPRKIRRVEDGAAPQVVVVGNVTKRIWGDGLPVEYSIPTGAKMGEMDRVRCYAAAGDAPALRAHELVWMQHCKKYCSKAISCLIGGPINNMIFESLPNASAGTSMYHITSRQPSLLRVAMREYAGRYNLVRPLGMGAAVEGARLTASYFSKTMEKQNKKFG